MKINICMPCISVFLFTSTFSRTWIRYCRACTLAWALPPLSPFCASECTSPHRPPRGNALPARGGGGRAASHARLVAGPARTRRHEGESRRRRAAARALRHPAPSLTASTLESSFILQSRVEANFHNFTKDIELCLRAHIWRMQ